MKASRLPWLLLALVAVAALAAFGEAPSPPATPADAERLPEIRALLPRENVPDARGNPFAAVPAAPTPLDTQAETGGRFRAVPPAPSLPPPLPWRAIGKQFDEQEGWTVFLARGEETRIVRAGDMLDEHLRVVAIRPPELILQPSGKTTRLTLDIGAAPE